MSKQDFYETLGVDRSANKDEIKKAYRKLAMKYHPDKNPDNKDAESKFKEASHAAEVLLSEEKRSRYDQFGHAGVDGQASGGFGGGAEGFSDLGDIFGDIFGDILGGGGGGRRRQRSRARSGNDLQMAVEVSFTEAAFGGDKSISLNKNVGCTDCKGSGAKPGSEPSTCPDCGGQGEIRRQQGFFTMSSTCPRCQGAGQVISNPCGGCTGRGYTKKKVDLEVKIPAGIDRGQRLKLSGEGDAGSAGGYPGDLYVVIDIKEHEFFSRDGFDVHCTVPISFSQAALGTQLEVPALTGKVEMKIPSGTQSGKKMRLKSKGIQRLGGYGQGDQIISIHVETPSQLKPEQKELMEKLAAFDDFNPMSKGFFNKVKDFFQ
jgi:molecular chaperone DnaJ